MAQNTRVISHEERRLLYKIKKNVQMSSLFEKFWSKKFNLRKNLRSRGLFLIVPAKKRLR